MKNQIINQIKSFINGSAQTSGTNHNVRKEVMAEFNKLFPNGFSIKFKGIKTPIEFESNWSLSGKTRYMTAVINRKDTLILTQGITYGLSSTNDVDMLSFSDSGILQVNGSINGAYTNLQNNLIESIQ